MFTDTDKLVVLYSRTPAPSLPIFPTVIKTRLTNSSICSYAEQQMFNGRYCVRVTISVRSLHDANKALSSVLASTVLWDVLRSQHRDAQTGKEDDFYLRSSAVGGRRRMCYCTERAVCQCVMLCGWVCAPVLLYNLCSCKMIGTKRRHIIHY